MKVGFVGTGTMGRPMMRNLVAKGFTVVAYDIEPAPKRVVLGLVSTKTPALESADGLKRRIEEAARYVPLDRLGLSPQCGFSSAPGSGQPITPDDQRRKLSLVLDVAEAVWGARS